MEASERGRKEKSVSPCPLIDLVLLAEVRLALVDEEDPRRGDCY